MINIVEFQTAQVVDSDETERTAVITSSLTPPSHTVTKYVTKDDYVNSNPGRKPVYTTSHKEAIGAAVVYVHTGERINRSLELDAAIKAGEL